MARVLKWILLGGSSAIISVAIVLWFNTADNNKNSSPLSCDTGIGTISEIRFSAKVLINQSLSTGSQKAQILEAMQKQASYSTIALGRMNPGSGIKHSAGQVLTAKFEVEKIESTSYGYNISARHPEPSALDTKSPYVKKFLEIGQTNASDPALLVHYKATVPFAVCWIEDQQVEELELFLPLDPHLAFWLSSGNYVKRRWDLTEKEAILNPCSTDETADLPLPDHFWYFWDPTRITRDKEVCFRQELKRVFSSKAKINSRLSLGEYGRYKIPPTKSKDPLRISTLIETSVPYAPIFNDFQNIENNLAEFLSKPDPAEAIHLLPVHRGDKADLNLNKFFIHLWHVQRLMQSPVKFEVYINKEMVRASGRGKLKQSGQEVFLQSILFSRTQSSADSRKLVEQILSASEVAIFESHSGLGHFLPADQFDLFLSHSMGDSEVKFRWLALFICYSYPYYNPVISEVSKEGKSSTLIRTIHAHSDLEARSLTATLWLLDEKLAKNESVLNWDFARRFQIDGGFVLDSF